jgi:FtsP/CotA-like multicopper oxidase with cupredoxin domain
VAVVFAAAVGLAAACSNDNVITDESTDGSGGEERCFVLADGSCVEETFANPPVLQPNAEGVHVLEMGVAEVQLNGQRHCVRAYNGAIPGPTIETPARVGSDQRQVRVDVINRYVDHDYQPLNTDECTCVDDVTAQSCSPSGHAQGLKHGGSSEQCVCTNQDGELCHLFDSNTTNLHAHGSHVSPDFATGGGCVQQGTLQCRACSGDNEGAPECFSGDDVISVIEPGMGRRYRWDIDEDSTHHEGLNWYHPHIHGSTAIQVASGAVGAWIVRGAMDQVPGMDNARERLLIYSSPQLTDNGYEPLADGVPCTENTITFDRFAPLADTSALQTNLINGIRRPRMILAPGQIERWRLLHTAPVDEVFLSLVRGTDSECSNWDVSDAIALPQVARDGLVMPRPADGQGWPYAPEQVFMSPGYRIEALLDGSQMQHGDTWCLVAVRYAQESDSPLTDGPVGITEPISQQDVLDRLNVGDVIAIVNVTDDAGPPTSTTMPDLEAIAALAPASTSTDGTDLLQECERVQAITDYDEIDQLVAFQIGFSLEGPDACGCSDHNVNCQNYEHVSRERYPYDRVLPLNTLEHWRVYAAFDGHPFHIHINPFFVCPLPPPESAGPNVQGYLYEPPFGHWRDTYLINLGRYADVLTEYRTHTGSYVFHCHKLTHEDHGMMELMRVCDPATESCDTLCDGGPCGWDECRPGDDECERQWFATNCLLDGSCGAAPQWCTSCLDDPNACPPGSYCSDQETYDLNRRCVPGCQTNDHCTLTDACVDGACVATACDAPCRPPETCQHGACVGP